jgi:hypothetical protein
LVVDSVFISGFSANPGRGIEVLGPNVPGAFQQLSVSNSIIFDNGVGTSGGGGIVLGQTGGLNPNVGVIRATLSNVELKRNNIGLRVSPNTEVTVQDCTMEHNISFNLVAFSGGGPAYVNVDDCMLSESIGGTGIHAEGFNAIIQVSRSVITGNNFGVTTANAGQVLSAGNNVLRSNFGGNGAFTGSFATQ